VKEERIRRGAVFQWEMLSMANLYFSARNMSVLTKNCAVARPKNATEGHLREVYNTARAIRDVFDVHNRAGDEIQARRLN